MTRARDLADGTFANDLTVDTNTLYVDSTNNRVGIGTASPIQTLSVSAPSALVDITSTTGTSFNGLELKNSSGSFYIGQDNSTGSFYGAANARVLYSSGAYPIAFFTNGSNERLRIDSSGNVGIGTSSPSNLLQATTSATASVPSAGASGHAFAAGSASYGVVAGALTNGNSYIQVTRWDGTASNYNLLLNPNGGNVGIGTAAPAHLVDAINTAGSATARFGSTYNIGANDGTVIIGNGGSGDAMLRFDYEGTNTDRARIGVTSSGQQLEFYTAGDNERMRIDSSGNVGIGGAPSAKLDINNGALGRTLIQYNGTSYNYFDVDNHVWRSASASEYMRIDSSGNVLVGKTANSIAGAGVVIRGSGELFSTRAGDVAGFNRLTTDGPIVQFYKDSSVVGGIGSRDGFVTIHNGDTGIGFDAANDHIRPISSTGSRDAAIDLGRSATRFKDLYLSGNANVGDLIGPASANFDIRTGSGTGDMIFYTNGSERARIDANGRLLVGKTSATITTAGQTVYFGQINGTVDSSNVCTFNRLTNDGTLVDLRQDSVQEGTISVSGTTVSYNGGHLSRWGQTTDGQPIAGLVKGTVMTNLDQMAVWEKDGVTEDNEQLNCLAVSSVEGDANVAGVFVNYDGADPDYPNDINLAMTGDMIIRIASGTTVARGDLLMSAGDGTAKPQGDDIVRSKTIAKVTSTNVSHTYDDGSYCVPCVLMAC